PADRWRAPGREIGRPSDYRKSGRSRGSAARSPARPAATWRPGNPNSRESARLERAAHCDRNASTVPLEVSGGKRGRRIALSWDCSLDVWFVPDGGLVVT